MGVRTFRGSLWLLFLAICCIGMVASTLYAGTPSANPLAESLLAEQFTDVNSIITDFRGQQLQGIDLIPPTAPVMIFAEVVHVFDPKRFDNALLDALVGVDRDGTTVFPLLVFEDKETRELVFANAENTEVLAITDSSYNPLWLLYGKRPELNNTVRSDDEFLTLAEQYDSSKVAVRYNLLPKRDLDAYLAAQEPDFPIVMMSMGGPPTNIYFTAIERNSSSIDVGIAYPTNVTSLDVFSVDGGNGLIDFWWNLRDTVSLSSSTNYTTWTDSSATGAVIRFYALADAATNSITDPDDDTLTWGREHYMYHTCPTNSDTDGDNISDDVEVLTNNTDPNNDDTNSPSVAIDTPEEGFTWVWLP